MTTATDTQSPAAEEKQDEAVQESSVKLTPAGLIEWDESEADKESATAGAKLLNQVVPLFNKLQDITATFNAATDVDEAVKAWTPAENSEEAKLAKQIEQAKALIAKNEAILAETARKEVLASVAPDFDEAKVKAAFKDTRNELRERLKSIRETFDMLGYVEYELSPTGRKTAYKGTNEYGEILVKLYDMPNIEKGSSAGGSDDAAKAERKAAKDWGKANGWTVADKGQISKELLEAYRASLNSEESDDK